MHFSNHFLAAAIMARTTKPVALLSRNPFGITITAVLKRSGIEQPK
jgi:hypothetical protein